MDRSLPNMGVAIPMANKIILNPSELATQAKEVRWFIFYHECGHMKGHLDEKRADEYAVQRASEEGWLTQEVLARICRSYGPMNAPATRSHPAPRDRCNAVMAAANRYRQPPEGDPAVGTMVTSGPQPERAPAMTVVRGTVFTSLPLANR